MKGYFIDMDGKCVSLGESITFGKWDQSFVDVNSVD